MTDFLAAEKSCPFLFHESARDSEFLHGVSVYSIYNESLLIFEAPVYEARA